MDPNPKLDLNDPTTAGLLAAEAFERAGIAHAMYGGLLIAAYGEPRETRDADFAMVDATAREAGAALKLAGLDTSLSFEGTRFGGLTISRLALLGSAGTSGLNTIDLIRPRSARYAAAAVARAEEAFLRGRRLKVLTPEDFIAFKVLSTRDKDLDDAASVLRRSGDLVDGTALEVEIESLAREIPDAGVPGRYAEILRRAGK
jgi:hypothetical protein